MKLLFVHQYLGALGGAESTLLLTASEFKERGHEVALLYSRTTGKCEQAWRDVFATDLFRSAGPANVEHLEAALARFQPDAIFVHNIDDLHLLESLLATRVPTVRMVHDHALYCMREYKYNYFTRQICTRAAGAHCVFPCLATLVRSKEGAFPIEFASYSRKLRELELNRQCKRFIVYSDYCRQELVRNGFESGLIHEYVPVRNAADALPPSSFSSRNLVLFAGQIIRGKGVDILLRALARVKVPFECLIMGEGSHRAHCEKLARKLGLQHRVRFTGFLSQDEMRANFIEASVFAVSSVWPEPFGLVGPEAMRFGLPVVAFDAGGIREWLLHNQTGCLIPWMDIDAYAAAIESLLRDKVLARAMGVRGRDRVTAQYNLQRQVNRLEKVFADVIKSEPVLIQ